MKKKQHSRDTDDRSNGGQARQKQTTPPGRQLNASSGHNAENHPSWGHPRNHKKNKTRQKQKQRPTGEHTQQNTPKKTKPKSQPNTSETQRLS